MNAIVTIGADNAPVTTSLVIAEGTQVQHKNVLELIRKNISDLQEFGLVAFETRARLKGQHGGGDTEYAVLNEQQATLVFTYMRNTEPVKKFKLALVKAFFEMAKKLREQSGPRVPALPDFTDPAAAAVAWAEQYRARQDLEARIEADKPKVAFTEQVLASNVTLSPTETAKLIGYPPRKFGDYLRQIRAVWATKNLAMQWMLDKGLMVHRFHAVVHADKTVEEKPYPHFTTASVFYIYRRMLKEGLIERNSQIELSMK